MDESAYIRTLRKRLNEDPGSPLMLSLAEELRKKDMLDDAIAVLAEGTRKNPDFIPARLALGRWYLAAGRPEEAQKEFEEAVRRDPGNIYARRGLALLNVPEVSEGNRDELISRLNGFLAAIKTEFSRRPSRRDRVLGKLNGFLEAVRLRFSGDINAA